MRIVGEIRGRIFVFPPAKVGDAVAFVGSVFGCMIVASETSHPRVRTFLAEYSVQVLQLLERRREADAVISVKGVKTQWEESINGKSN